jgi:hypothetical protein
MKKPTSFSILPCLQISMVISKKTFQIKLINLKTTHGGML